VVVVVVVHPITVEQLVQVAQVAVVQGQKAQLNQQHQALLTQAVAVVESAMSPTQAVLCQVQAVQVLWS
jgi:hypothetical protein